MKRRLNKKGIVVLAFVSFILLLIIISFSTYFLKLRAVSRNSVPVSFRIEEGDTYSSIVKKLEDSNLIRSDLAYKIYVKTHKFDTLKVGIYELNQNMSVGKILSVLSSDNYKEDYVQITFKEGINMRHIASLISEYTSNSEDDVYSLLKDKDYLNSLINDYWFITDEILDDRIYYPLEGYLFPDTYQFSMNANVRDIFKAMLDQMDLKLSGYKEQISNGSYSVHKLLTLASIVELEAGFSHEMNGIAAVFYNRINSGWTLGSDVTTYYASRKDFTVDLTINELNECNGYNTRATCFAGLPVGPISSPSLESIEGVINPAQSDYYYFVADKYGNTYFSKTDSEHMAIISKLKSEGLWYVYE